MIDTLNLIITVVTFFVSYKLANKLASLNYFSFLFHRRGRYGSIDGLRGYLALSVFIHHFISRWYWHLTGSFSRPPEDYFHNIGKIGVMIFFMITGFLFITKVVLDKRKTDWHQLYKSRIFRIYPLYLFVLVLVSIIVFYKTNFQLNVDLFTLIKAYTRWFIFSGSVINDFGDTKNIIAGVDWTLKYEWAFYLSLPFIVWLLNKNKIKFVLFILLALLLSSLDLVLFGQHTLHFLFFIIGGLIAYLNSFELDIDHIIHSNYYSFIVLSLLVFSLFYPYTYGLLQIISVSIFFTFIALGNTMFGFFHSKASVLLGEISYSIYLLHGLILYILFSIIKVVDVKELSLLQYEYSMPIIAILIIFISIITHITIELPGIRYGKKKTKISDEKIIK